MMVRSEVSADATEWTIPASRHKSKRDFLVPMSEAAIYWRMAQSSPENLRPAEPG
jgi:hypothetical protein